jgi:hypothetical protein
MPEKPMMAVKRHRAPAAVETDQEQNASSALRFIGLRSVLKEKTDGLTDEFGPVSDSQDVRVVEDVKPYEQGDDHDGDRVGEELAFRHDVSHLGL